MNLKTINKILSILFLISISSVSNAKNLGSIASSRFGTLYTLDGGLLTNARAKLLNPANFGPGGTVNDPIVITDVAAPITLPLLQTFDAFFIGFLLDSHANAFTAPELAAMNNYVNSGGTMLITCDHSNYDAVCASFGHPITSTTSNALPTASPTVAGVAHPIFTSPFGVVTQLNLDGTVGIFTNNSGTILAINDNAGNNPVVIERTVGLGKLILVTDINVFWGGTSAGNGVSTNNDRFVTNVFASTLGLNATSTAPVPSLSFYSLILLTGLLGLFGMRRKRRIK